MNIIPNGTTVEIIGNEIKGIIVSASIDGITNPHVEYRVVWWGGGLRNSSWMQEYEIKPYIDNRKKAGMVNYEEKPDRLIE